MKKFISKSIIVLGMIALSGCSAPATNFDKTFSQSASAVKVVIDKDIKLGSVKKLVEVYFNKDHSVAIAEFDDGSLQKYCSGEGGWSPC